MPKKCSCWIKIIFYSSAKASLSCYFLITKDWLAGLFIFGLSTGGASILGLLTGLLYWIVFHLIAFHRHCNNCKLKVWFNSRLNKSVEALSSKHGLTCISLTHLIKICKLFFDLMLLCRTSLHSKNKFEAH